MNIRDLNKKLHEVLEFGDLTQCVAKIVDKGNSFELKGIVSEATNFKDEQEMEDFFQNRLEIEDPEVSLILAYHKGDVWNSNEPLYDEAGDELPLEYHKISESVDLYVAPQLHSDLKELIAQFNDELKFFSYNDQNEPGITNMISIAEDILSKLKLYQSQEDTIL